MQVDSTYGGMFANALQGMQRSTNQVTDASARIAENGASDIGAMVDLVEGEQLYAANARVLETESQMLGQLIDTQA